MAINELVLSVLFYFLNLAFLVLAKSAFFLMMGIFFKLLFFFLNLSVTGR